jgi:hypothetical protein
VIGSPAKAKGVNHYLANPFYVLARSKKGRWAMERDHHFIDIKNDKYSKI